MKIFIAVLVFGAMAWLFMRAQKSTTKRTPSERSVRQTDDYQIWLNIIKDRKSHTKEFSLFETKAAVLWNDGEEEAEVICITAFRNGKPMTKKWDHFAFNLKEGYWVGQQPKGASAQIREELKANGLT